MIGELRALQQLAAQRRLEGKQLLRLEVRVGGVGVEEAMLWLRSQSNLFPQSRQLAAVGGMWSGASCQWQRRPALRPGQGRNSAGLSVLRWLSL
jgi:hypothetical protein